MLTWDSMLWARKVSSSRVDCSLVSRSFFLVPALPSPPSSLGLGSCDRRASSSSVIFNLFRAPFSALAPTAASSLTLCGNSRSSRTAEDDLRSPWLRFRSPPPIPRPSHDFPKSSASMALALYMVSESSLLHKDLAS
jgi:hypothetical protein